MKTKHALSMMTAATLGAALCACGGGNDASQATSTPGPTTKSVTASPSATTLGVGKAQSVKLSEPGYTGSFTTDATGCSGVAKVTTASDGSVQVVASTPGTCTLKFASADGSSGSLGVTVTGMGVAELVKPMGIAFRDGKLYVANNGSGEILVYDETVGSDGTVSLAPDLMSPITDGVEAPTALAFDRAGNLYVANAGSANTVTVYDTSGKLKPELTITQGIDSPTGVSVDHTGTVLVSNAVSGSVSQYVPDSTQAGRPILVDKKTTDWLAHPFTATGFVSYVAGDVVIGAAGASNVMAYADVGTAAGPNMTWDTIHVLTDYSGLSPSGFAYFAGNSQVQPQFYLTDTAHNAVMIFDALWTLINYIESNHGIADPYGIAVDDKGNIIVGSRGTNTITVFDPTGNGDPILILR